MVRANCMHFDRIVHTLHLRNVPDEVMDRLERLARAAGTSVEAVAIRELNAATRRVDNASLVATLPHRGLSTDAIVGAIDDDRG